MGRCSSPPILKLSNIDHRYGGRKRMMLLIIDPSRLLPVTEGTVLSPGVKGASCPNPSKRRHSVDWRRFQQRPCRAVPNSISVHLSWYGAMTARMQAVQQMPLKPSMIQ
jgi:hypothetical protein